MTYYSERKGNEPNKHFIPPSASKSIFDRPLTIDEVKKVGAFYVEMRSTSFRTYFAQSIKLVRSVDDKAVHLLGEFKPHLEIAEFENYNIGWRAWLSVPSDKTRESFPWDPVKKCHGVGYDWEYHVDSLLSEMVDDVDNAKLRELWP